jgi:hypothetical protein
MGTALELRGISSKYVVERERREAAAREGADLDFGWDLLLVTYL